jgi:hypothetical protein
VTNRPTTTLSTDELQDGGLFNLFDLGAAIATAPDAAIEQAFNDAIAVAGLSDTFEAIPHFAGLAVSGCGSSATTTSSHSAAVVKATPVVQMKQTPQQAGSGDYNMSTLATSFEQMYNSQPGAQLDVGSTNCMITGTGTATCMGTVDGSPYGQTVQINPAGTNWMTLGGNN